MVPCRKVRPPRVARSPIALECIYNKTVHLVPSSGKTSANSLIIGEVVNVHIDDSVIVNGNIDMARIGLSPDWATWTTPRSTTSSPCIASRHARLRLRRRDGFE